MTSVRRGFAIGAGFGLAAAAIDLWLWMLRVMQLRMGFGVTMLAQNALVLVALGALLGLLGAPLLRSGGRAAALLHVAWLCGAWYAIERTLAIDSPVLSRGVMLRPFGAGAVALVALVLERIARRFAAAPWVLAGLAAVAGLLAPTVYLAATTPRSQPHAALPPARAGAPDVVLVVLDTVRAQSLASYGHPRDTSATFDALARDGALFADATSPSTWSLPSHASLFTGRYPTSHGAHGQPSFLDGRFPTLAEVLAARGYETFCFTANPWISDGLGLTRGFAEQDGSWKSKRGSSFAGQVLERLGFGEADKGGAAVAEGFAAWMRARPQSARPSFAFLNFLEAHFPYHQLPSEYRDRYTDKPPDELRRISLGILGQQFGGPSVDAAAVGDDARAMYDGGVAYTDALLGRVVDALRDSGRLDRTILVVLADHGEILGEHGGFFGHGPSVYQSVIGVPLLVRYPPRIAARTRIETPVSTLGVFATILDLAEIEAPPTLQVGSLVNGGNGVAGPILSELVALTGPGARANRDDVQMRAGQHLRAYRSGGWKLVETSNGGPFLYDLESDPAESRDLARERPEQVARLAAELEAARERLELPRLEEIGGHAPAPKLDADTEKRLRELGYLR